MTRTRRISSSRLALGFVTVLAPALTAGPAPSAQEFATPAPAAETGEAEVAPAPAGWSVQVRVDQARRSEQLDALAHLRTGRDPVGFAEVLAEFQQGFAAESSALEAFLTSRGAEVGGRFAFGHALAVAGLTPQLESELAGRADVVRIEQARLRGPAMAKATNAAHHDSVGANFLPAPGGGFVQGQGVTIAMLDTGIDADHAGSGRPHAAFFPNGNPNLQTGGGLGGSRLLSSEVGGGWLSPSDPEDVHGHGTRMASIAGGARFNFLPDVGHSPARAASLRSWRISSDGTSGLASTVTMTSAFNLAAAEPDVLVCNMSYDGDPGAQSLLNHTIDDVSRSGIVVTLSAGNNGPASQYFHGAYNALTVGASDVDTKEPYDFPGFQTSAVGPRDDGRRYPDLLAIGEALTCADKDNESGSIDSYGSSGGAALVAGSAALVRQAAPLASSLETKAILLNTVQDVVLGDPNARGWGYLHTKSAVQVALALDWTTGTIQPGDEELIVDSFTAGDSVSLTLVWERKQTFPGPAFGSISDLDLRVLGPAGQPIGFSGSDRDNVEQLRFIAPATGNYSIIVRGEYVLDQEVGGGTNYVVAGAQGVPVASPIACPGTAPFVVHVEPAFVETSGPYSVFTLKGCNLAGTSSVSVGGIAAGFTQKGPFQLKVSVPAGVPLGAQLVDIVTPAGNHSALVQIGAGGPKLDAHWPTIDTGAVSLGLHAQPGDLFWIGASGILGASSLPGLVDFGIGNNFAGLFFLGGGIIPVWGHQSLSYFMPGLPQGTYVYFQAAVLDGVMLTAPLAMTNIVGLIKF